MKVLKTYNWNRRDFTATLVCENCMHTQVDTHGYDDHNFYENVIPSIPCEKCTESTVSLGPKSSIELITPKYPSHINL